MKPCDYSEIEIAAKDEKKFHSKFILLSMIKLFALCT